MTFIRVLFWRALALVALVLGTIGIVLPGLPTVPFYLLSAWAASKGWPALERWLLEHAHYGPIIHGWRERRAIPRRAKWMATVFMVISVTLMWLSTLPMLVSAHLTVFLFVVAIWLWTRPE